LVITSEPELVHAVEVREPLEQSDHNMISWESHLDVCHRITNHRRLNYAKANLNGMRAELQQVDWDTLLSGDIHNSWSVFKNKVHELESKYIPTTTLKSKQTFKPIWMTNRTLKLVQRKRRIYSKYKNNDHPACKQANIEARKELRKSKRKFEKMLAKNIKNDKKTFFAYVRCKSKSKFTPGPLLNKAGETVSDLKESADMFNCYFSSVFTKEDLSTVQSQQILLLWILRKELLKS